MALILFAASPALPQQEVGENPSPTLPSKKEGSEFLLSERRGRSKATEEDSKYPIEEFQQRAIKKSSEIRVVDQAIQLMKSKKWTALAPGVGIGNNFVGDGDIRFNVNVDLVEMLGGGKIRQINLDVAELQLRKLELINKINLQVLERVLALQRAERNTKRLKSKLKKIKAKISFFEMEFEDGSRSPDSLFSYWQMEEDLEDKILDKQDSVTLERARLEQLVGVF